MGFLDDSSVLIAGAGRGLGRRVALAASREGARVGVLARNADTIQSIAREIDPTGGRAVAVQGDVTDEASCQAAVEDALKALGGLDALVCVAALDTIFGGLLSGAWEDWQRAVEANLLGTMRVTRLALPALIETKGAVVLVGTQTVFMPPPEAPQAAYAASKSALIGAMRALAHEIGPLGVRVNMVSPGWMWGPAVEGFVRSRAETEGVAVDDVISSITKDIPLRRMPTDEEVAEVILFLASPRGAGVTGQNLLVNGGEVMH